MKHPVPDFHPQLWAENTKNSTEDALDWLQAGHKQRPRSFRPGVPSFGSPPPQPVNLFRTMKLSKPSSATCHH